MLVIGVSIVSSFLTFYVKLGVTRKDYYIGTILASIVISLVIVLVAGIVSLVEGIFISNGMGLHQDYAWILLLFVYVLYLITYFTAGWLIGAGFYRYGAGGLLFIVLAVAMIFVFEALWTMELPIAVAGTFVLLSASWFVLRLITKRVRIKLK